MVQTVSTTAPLRNSISIAADALIAAKAINKDEQLTDHLDTLLEAAETVKKGPLFVMVDLIRVVGLKILLAWPDFGTDAKQSNNPDKYETTAPNAKGDQVKHVGSFYGDLAKDHIEGQKALQIIEGLKLAAINSSDCPEEYKALSKLEIQQRLTVQTQRLTALKNLFGKANALAKQIEHLNEMFGETMLIGYSKAGDGVTPAPTTVPMYVQDKTDPLKTKGFSVSAFLRLNSEKAIAAGGSVSDLWFSGGAEKDEEETDGDADEYVIQTTDNLDNAIGSVAGWLDDVSNIRALYAYINAKNADGAYTHDDLLHSMKMIADEFNSILSKKDIAPRVEKAA